VYYSLVTLGNTMTNELLQGTLDVLVLKALSWGPRHGHGVARLIHQTTDGDFEIMDGSLYAALHRLEERGWVDSDWGLSDKGKRARFYSLTTRGRQQLRLETATWERYVASVSKLLTAAAVPV
jgi:PadR family transcriptional regulator PadR